MTSHRERAAIRAAKGYKRKKLLQDEHPSAYMPGVRRVVMAAGGVPDGQPQLDPLGFYSQGAVAAQQLPQAKGTPQQMAAMLQKQGVRPAEFAHAGYEQAFAGRPTVTREELAQHFAQNAPQLEEKVLGGAESVAAPRPTGGGSYVVDTPNGPHKIFTHNDEDSPTGVTHTVYSPKGFVVGQGFETLDHAVEEVSRWAGGTKYGGPDQTLPGGENYRELLLKTPGAPEGDEVSNRLFGVGLKEATPEQRAQALAEVERHPFYKSSHWEDPNVLVHVRMADRVEQPGPKEIVNIGHRIAAAVGVSTPDAMGSGAIVPAIMKGAITPQEAASYSRARRFQTPYSQEPGLEKRLLHVEEIQSDWGQEGRKKGFRGGAPGIVEEDGKFAVEGVNRWFPTREAAEAYAGDASVRHLAQARLDMRPPVGPFVGSTDGWTDLALKRILKEAAHGGYDGVVFTPGEHQHERSGNEGLYKYYDDIVPKRLKKLLKDIGHEHEPLQHDAGEHSLPGFRMTPELRERVKRGLPHFRDGGKVASDEAYVDPASGLIGEWQWRDLPDVRADLKGLSEIPSHVKAFGSFMDETANRAGAKGLSARDLIKAYTITRASIQRQAVDHGKLRASGLVLPGDVAGKVRPEGAFGHWLHTNMGQKYLREAERGRVAQDAVADAVRVMAPFGKHEKDIPDALVWAAQNLPGREEEVSRLVAAAQQGESPPEDWRAFTKDVRGIGPSKSGFVSSLMGRGDQPTLDARQIILHTGEPTKNASKYIARKGGRGGEEAVNRLAARQSALDLGGAEGLEPYYQHLAHHAVWDAAGDEVTTHDDVMQAMRGAASGGRIEGDSLADHPLARLFADLGMPGLGGEEEGDREGFKGGGSPDADRVRKALERVASPFSDDPKMVEQALKMADVYRLPQDASFGTGSFFDIKPPMAAKDVSATIGDIPGVQPRAKRAMGWDEFYEGAKGGTLLNLGGDRSALGRLTHINGQELAWPVDLQAGPGYMLEPNPGAVWANAAGHTTALRNKIRKAADKGDVYGVYAPMGPQSADFAHHMFDAVMAQIPKLKIKKKDLAGFDRSLKQGAHADTADRDRARDLMVKWPGLANAKEASEFARSLPGKHRAAIIKHMDKRVWADRGFPNIGVTRVAITDPDVRETGGNMMGHRVVKLDPDRVAQETALQHASYDSPTAGEYVGDVPPVQRHYVMPDVTEGMLAKPTSGGHIVHPYSLDAMGRGTARKLFEEQKQLQPINERMIESVNQGLQNQPRYGFKDGGAATTQGSVFAPGKRPKRQHPALSIPGVHLRGDTHIAVFKGGRRG